MNTALVTTLRAAAVFAITTGVAFASPESEALAANSGVGIGAGIAIGVAAIGAALGQARAAAAALEGMARNPQTGGMLQTPMIIALVFMETLVLFAFVIAAKLAQIF